MLTVIQFRMFNVSLYLEVVVDTVDQIPKLDASSFMLTKDRNNSTPAFLVSEQTSYRLAAEPIDIKLLRSPDMENIPEMIEDGGLEVPQLNRWCSDFSFFFSLGCTIV